ncbi:hypothetical protein Zmor_004265, partial [Zophobas morio]
KWIYPINLPERSYQFNIVKNCLLHNTLVALPTGLGKTFIAAAVMLNYKRWFPNGLVIFMAPTRPLVTQQIEACRKIAGIPQDVLVEMTGLHSQSLRDVKWKDASVVFLTPQILANDLRRGAVDPLKIVCLVIDEAHKATGNHAYVAVVRQLRLSQARYRLVALSATPGDSEAAVIKLISNLEISHLELRTEESADVKPYLPGRHMELIVVDSGSQIRDLKSKFSEVLGKSLDFLVNTGAYWERKPEKVSKYLLLRARETFHRKYPRGTHPSSAAILLNFYLAISLSHAYHLLDRNGCQVCFNYLKKITTSGSPASRATLLKSVEFRTFMSDLQLCCESGENIQKVHPKLHKLLEITLKHFHQCQEDTRVMIFSHFRESVLEIVNYLRSAGSNRLKVQGFIGQASGRDFTGLSQKQQLSILEDFRRGDCNVLVATCIGEEGLDIGHVDLVICFDAHASPTRLIQRMGRCGRKKKGRIVTLVCKGQEHENFKKSVKAQDVLFQSFMLFIMRIVYLYSIFRNKVAPYLTGSTKGASLLETSDSDSDIIGNTLTGLGLSRVAETSCLDSQGSSRDSSETLEPVDSPLKPALIRPTSPLAKSLNDSFGIDWDNVEVNIIKNVSTYFLTHY